MLKTNGRLILIPKTNDNETKDGHDRVQNSILPQSVSQINSSKMTELESVLMVQLLSYKICFAQTEVRTFFSVNKPYVKTWKHLHFNGTLILIIRGVRPN